MPACLEVCRFTRSALSSCPIRAKKSKKCSSHFRRRNAIHVHSRPLATAPSQTPAPSHPPSNVTSRHQILTLLYKTKALVPQVLNPVGSGVPFTESSEFWNDILAAAYDDYQSTAERPARVVVYGTDQWSCSDRLITALLCEPLASDNVAHELLRNRHREFPAEHHLTISHPNSGMANAATIKVPSSYLQQFSVPIQITEITASLEHGALPITKADSSLLFLADFPIVVCNPTLTPLSNIYQSRLPSNVILVLISPPTVDSAANIHPNCIPSVTEIKATLFVDPSRAVKALDNLRAAPDSSVAIQRYQDDFVGSGVSSITSTIRSMFDQPSHSPLTVLRTNFALAQLHSALSACQHAILCAEADINNILADTRLLRTQLEEACRRAPSDVFGYPCMKHRRSSIWPPILRPMPQDESLAAHRSSSAVDEVEEALTQARRKMSSFMDSFTWWRMLWRVDEISCFVTTAVERVWCRDLEKKLVMHTGRLASVQENFTTKIFSVVEKCQAKPPFKSALLHNSLRQQSMSTSYVVAPSALITPLHDRRRQLIAYPTMQLHVGGQRAAFGAGVGIFASASFTWCGWFGWFSGMGLGSSASVENTLLSAFASTLNLGIDPSTAVGLGVLGTLVSVRWAVGKWERAKKRWWEDWVRVCQGLERDLKATLDKVMKERVTVVAESGCAGIQQLADQRMEEIANAAKELKTLQSELEKIEEGLRKKA
ncbi:hypothetical protein AX17_003983 [Amanita inopinata Kibby_2008]|nr:hypothetical protein AX17_003983 [Amanita inopinata Kibby_2008]